MRQPYAIDTFDESKPIGSPIPIPKPLVYEPVLIPTPTTGGSINPFSPNVPISSGGTILPTILPFIDEHPIDQHPIDTYFPLDYPVKPSIDKSPIVYYPEPIKPILSPIDFPEDEPLYPIDYPEPKPTSIIPVSPLPSVSQTPFFGSTGMPGILAPLIPKPETVAIPVPKPGLLAAPIEVYLQPLTEIPQSIIPTQTVVPTIGPTQTPTSDAGGFDTIPSLLELYNTLTNAQPRLNVPSPSQPGTIVLPASQPPVQSSNNSLLIILAVLGIVVSIGLHLYFKHHG